MCHNMLSSLENTSIANISNASIEIPPIAFNGTGGNVGVFFTRYSTPILFPLAVPNGTLDNETNDTIDSVVIAATVAGMEISNLPEPVVITLTSNRIQDGSYTKYYKLQVRNIMALVG